MSRIRLGLVGVGKIARDQHLHVLAGNENFELVATASRNASVEGVASYRSLRELLDAEANIDAVSLCTPPGPRDADARIALDHGVHVLLEKPPAATLGAARDLCDRAQNSVLVASWHSRHAPAVEPARAWLSTRTLLKADICWKEDVRVWHPGQDWILDAGGMGVFDPGINALSILTRLVPERIILDSAHLAVPSDRQAPLQATLALRTSTGIPIDAAFDFLQTGAQTWRIQCHTDAGVMALHDGGARLEIDGVGQTLTIAPHHEYIGVYDNFAACIRARANDCDLHPLEIVADALMLGRRTPLAPFSF